MTLLAFAAAAARRRHLGVTSPKNRTASGVYASSRKDDNTNVKEKRAEQKRRLQRFYVDASTFASTLSDDASETTEEDPYHEASPSPQRKASALPENGVLPPALLPSVLRDGGEVAPRAPAAPLM